VLRTPGQPADRTLEQKLGRCRRWPVEIRRGSSKAGHRHSPGPSVSCPAFRWASASASDPPHHTTERRAWRTSEGWALPQPNRIPLPVARFPHSLAAGRYASSANQHQLILYTQSTHLSRIVSSLDISILTGSSPPHSRISTYGRMGQAFHKTPLLP
jgi:hypothetical protein